ncbi:hypothetical protein WJX74_006846 [Apatococcus lobatus]|uniref:RING-type domain-containing protein n=1 Tax=Apatococcus lobatus TaxID=904363 RepID=A0AAW1SH63_9CHLO
MEVDLDALEAETRCPVCLGVIRDARLVSVCMHRFCAECIEKWLRNAKENSCPQCREPMQSRRDCKRDVRFDRLLSVLYGNVDRYEEKMEKETSLEVAHAQGAAIQRAAELRRQARAGRSTLLGLPPRPRSAAAAGSDPGSGHRPAAPARTVQQQHPFALIKVSEPMQVAPVWQAAHKAHLVQPWYEDDDILDDPELYIYPDPPAAPGHPQNQPSRDATAAQPPQKRQRSGAHTAAASPAVPLLGPQSGRSSPSPGRMTASLPASRQPSPSPVFVIQPEGDAIKEAELLATRTQDAIDAEASSTTSCIQVRLVPAAGSDPIPADWAFLTCPSTMRLRDLQQALTSQAILGPATSRTQHHVTLLMPESSGSPAAPLKSSLYSKPLSEILLHAPNTAGPCTLACLFKSQASV